MPRTYTRREAIRTLGAGGALAAVGARAQTSALPASTALDQPATLEQIVNAAVARNDMAVRAVLPAQVTDLASPYRGSVPDAVGLHSAGSAGSVIEVCASAFVHPQSAFHGNTALLDRIRLAAGFLERSQSADGNIDLLSTNFNSPPDTGFVVHGVATAAAVGRRHGAPGIAEALRTFLTRAGAGMARGGVHTPNHRWVISSALAQIHELFPSPPLRARIDEWLAEGIDIDADGQFTERSTLTYNVVTDRALVVMAAKLGRPALLDPVRRNLRALTYLLHADGEVVTEISRRQDQYTRGGIGGYWFPVTYLAAQDQDGQFAAMARQSAATGARLSALLEYPELSRPLPAAQALPDDFEQPLPAVGITRLRRGPLSATFILGGSSRLLTFRFGDAVVEAVRFASAFFGKGQLIPDVAEKRRGATVFQQELEAPYYQPIGRPVTTATWDATRAERRQSEVNRLTQSVEVTEVPRGLRLRVQARGTVGVPVSVEIAFREGGRIEGCTPLAGSTDAFLLERGTGTYRAGGNEIRFGPGAAPHRYAQVRGAEPKLAGPSVYLTGYTPFDHTLTIEGA